MVFGMTVSFDTATRADGDKGLPTEQPIPRREMHYALD